MELRAKTEEVSLTGQKIIDASKEIDVLIDELYQNISNLVKNGYWQGISANNYLNSVLSDKDDLKNLNKALKKYGDVLVNNSKDLEALVQKYWKNS